tara:strand:- start:128 stop:313 length:186 start_codon:yes stop_codon:yes gene_type:complete
MNKENSKIAGAVVGVIIGLIMYATDVFAAPFYWGTLLWLAILAVGGSIVFAQLFHDSSKDE